MKNERIFSSIIVTVCLAVFAWMVVILNDLSEPQGVANCDQYEILIEALSDKVDCLIINNDSLMKIINGYKPETLIKTVFVPCEGGSHWTHYDVSTFPIGVRYKAKLNECKEN